MTRHRAVVAATLALVTVGLVGCSGSGPVPEPTRLPEGPPPVADRFTPDIPAELRVREPKDARGLDPCLLLTGDQLAGFGLDPATARSNQARYGAGCLWQYRDGSTTAGVDLTTNPRASKLPDIYRLRDNYDVVEILQIGGHPVLRADRYATGECNLALALALADDQILGVNAYYDGRVLPDPCAPARRMAELIIANLTTRP